MPKTPLRFLATPLSIAGVLSGCAFTPQIAEGVSLEPGAFDSRVRSVFPLGTDGAALAATLRAQGFSVETNGPNKFFASHNYWCANWTVDWTIDGKGRVSALTAQEPRCAGP